MCSKPFSHLVLALATLPGPQNGPSRANLPEGLGLSFSFLFLFVFMALSNAQYSMRQASLQCRVRAALCAAVASRALDFSLSARDDPDRRLTQGLLLTNLQVDSSPFTFSRPFEESLPVVLSAPIQPTHSSQPTN
jgi:hypothetical protein